MKASRSYFSALARTRDLVRLDCHYHKKKNINNTYYNVEIMYCYMYKAAARSFFLGMFCTTLVGGVGIII